MNKDRLQGAGREIKGSVKETVGKVAGDPETEAEGKAEKIVGKVQNRIGKAEDAVKREMRRL